jgi:hypothetical protein
MAPETFDITGLSGGIQPGMTVNLVIHRADGSTTRSAPALPHRHPR